MVDGKDLPVLKQEMELETDLHPQDEGEI